MVASRGVQPNQGASAVRSLTLCIAMDCCSGNDDSDDDGDDDDDDNDDDDDDDEDDDDDDDNDCLLYTSPSPRDQRGSRMPSSA